MLDLFTLEKICGYRADLNECEKLMRLLGARGTNSHRLPAGTDTAHFSVRDRVCKKCVIR